RPSPECFRSGPVRSRSRRTPRRSGPHRTAKSLSCLPPERFWFDVPSWGRSLSHTGKIESLARSHSTKGAGPLSSVFASFSRKTPWGPESWLYTARYEVFFCRHVRVARRRGGVRRASAGAAVGRAEH